jgi:hypothetical protein
MPYKRSGGIKRKLNAGNFQLTLKVIIEQYLTSCAHDLWAARFSLSANHKFFQETALHKVARLLAVSADRPSLVLPTLSSYADVVPQIVPADRS